eukprot:4016785-Alexandrium_andersonii.AAC.1
MTPLVRVGGVIWGVRGGVAPWGEQGDPGGAAAPPQARRRPLPAASSGLQCCCAVVVMLWEPADC